MDLQDLENITTILESEVQLREKIKERVGELDKKARTVTGLLNKVHSTPFNLLPKLTESVTLTLSSCQPITVALAEIIPPNEFWRWKDMWSNSIRTLVFAAGFVEYLNFRKLITIDQVSDILGKRLELPPEDYLQGIISLVNELSRLAINSVTMGNFDEPIKISLFVKDIFAGFSMVGNKQGKKTKGSYLQLNLKNDTLRRRFDSLKYDLKKVEEVVYDVSLRKLSSWHL